MRLLPTLALLLLVAAPAHAGKRIPRGESLPSEGEEMPAWQTADGRRSAWRELARWYIENGRPDEALEMVKRLRDEGEDTLELRLIQARSLAAQGIPDEAAQLLEDIVKQASKDPSVWAALGVVYVDLQRMPEAITAFEKALSLEDQDPATQNNLGFLQMSTGDCTNAVTHLERATSQDGTNARYRNNLAFALVCAGDADRALKLFRSTSVAEADARHDMGVAYERIGKVPSAILQYRAALTADPQHDRASESLQRLETPEASTDASPATEPNPGAEP